MTPLARKERPFLPMPKEQGTPGRLVEIKSAV
jgi:hypothetical protein